MNNENLIKKDNNNSYCLVFRNFQGLEELEIMNIFSKYGRVISVQAAGDKKGYRFVRYFNLNDAQYAISHVHNDGIKLCSHRFRKDKKQNNANDEFKRPSYPSYKGETKCQSECDSISETSSEKSSKQKFRMSHSQLQCRSTSLISLRNCEQKFIDERTKNNIQSVGDEEVVPKLAIRKKIVTAGEVVVGNIPPSFGAAYLLHLFDKYLPIAISHILIEPKTNFRYCHVYFLNNMDAESAERQFDKYNLMGYRLIVVKPNNLIKFVNT